MTYEVGLSMNNFRLQYTYKSDKSRICGVMTSVLASCAVDRGFICGVMTSVLASGAVDRGFEPRSAKDYKIGICC